LVLNRDSIKNGIVEKLLQEGCRKGLIDRWTAEQRLESRNEVLARRPSDDIWVFGYGSLIWNPAFHFERSAHALLYGYHRAFCLWTPLGRGSPDNPGLILGLERGGSCHGMAFKLHKDQIEEELDVVWAREMPTGSYKPTWVKLRSGNETVDAIAFVIQRDQPRYACKIPIEKVAQSIATAEGPLGTCADYLFNTVEALDKMNVPDRYLHQVRKRVIALQRENGGPKP
jgi:cation transport protein ChaC